MLNTQVRLNQNQVQSFLELYGQGDESIDGLQDKYKIKHKRLLTEAAQLMFNEYSDDPEFTCFTSLDGEPVYE
jgi:hypothetical protein